MQLFDNVSEAACIEEVVMSPGMIGAIGGLIAGFMRSLVGILGIRIGVQYRQQASKNWGGVFYYAYTQ